MSELVHGGIATAKKFGFFYLWFTREGCMIRFFRELKAMNSHRYTPAVIVVTDEQPNPVVVIGEPDAPNGLWMLEDGRKIKTTQIEEFETFRVLRGYSQN